MTVGSPGATRIIAAVSQVISNVIDNNMSMQDAITASRWFTTASGVVHVDGRTPASTIDALKQWGYEVNVRAPWDNYFGGVQGVLDDYKTRRLHGGADPRRDGEAKAF